MLLVPHFFELVDSLVLLLLRESLVALILDDQQVVLWLHFLGQWISALVGISLVLGSQILYTRQFIGYPVEMIEFVLDFLE